MDLHFHVDMSLLNGQTYDIKMVFKKLLIGYSTLFCSTYIYHLGQQFWILDLRPLNQLFYEVYYHYTLENSGSPIWFFHPSEYSHKKMPTT